MCMCHIIKKSIKSNQPDPLGAGPIIRVTLNSYK